MWYQWLHPSWCKSAFTKCSHNLTDLRTVVAHQPNWDSDWHSVKRRKKAPWSASYCQVMRSQLKQILLMREAHPPISQGCRDSNRNSMPTMNYRKPSVPDKSICNYLQFSGNGCLTVPLRHLMKTILLEVGLFALGRLRLMRFWLVQAPTASKPPSICQLFQSWTSLRIWGEQ